MESTTRPRKSPVGAIVIVVLVVAVLVAGGFYYVAYRGRQAQLRRDEALRQKENARNVAEAAQKHVPLAPAVTMPSTQAFGH